MSFQFLKKQLFRVAKEYIDRLTYLDRQLAHINPNLRSKDLDDFVKRMIDKNCFINQFAPSLIVVDPRGNVRVVISSMSGKKFIRMEDEETRIPEKVVDFSKEGLLEAEKFLMRDRS